MKLLRRTQFGNPILRQVARRLNTNEIISEPVQALITNMYHTLTTKKYGVGLAAPQVGQGIALSIIAIQATEARPNVETFKLTIINPEITETHGQKSQLWEGCISLGDVFAKVPRYKRVRLKYQDEAGAPHEKEFTGLVAHVIQHEVDHLNGTLFVDRVTDTSSYATLAEYKKRFRSQKAVSTDKPKEK